MPLQCLLITSFFNYLHLELSLHPIAVTVVYFEIVLKGSRCKQEPKQCSLKQHVASSWFFLQEFSSSGRQIMAMHVW